MSARLLSMERSKILITGGLGFIFSHVTEYFVRQGHEVIVADDLSEGSHPEIIDGSFRHHELDVSAADAIERILAEEPDYIIHAAANSDVDHSIREPGEVARANTLGSFHLFEAARRLPNLKKLLYVSTDEVYGECDVQKAECDPLMPRNPYSGSKAAGSLFRMVYENTYPELRGKLVESRFCNVFGPRQDTRKIMPIIKRALETGEPVPVFDEGGSYREYIHVDNIPPAVETILGQGEGIYNVTLGDGYRVADLVRKAAELAGRDIATTRSHRPGIDMKYQMDASRILSLGWRPRYTFEEGLRKYLNL